MWQLQAEVSTIRRPRNHLCQTLSPWDLGRHIWTPSGLTRSILTSTRLPAIRFLYPKWTVSKSWVNWRRPQRPRETRLSHLSTWTTPDSPWDHSWALIKLLQKLNKWCTRQRWSRLSIPNRWIGPSLSKAISARRAFAFLTLSTLETTISGWQSSTSM